MISPSHCESAFFSGRVIDLELFADVTFIHVKNTEVAVEVIFECEYTCSCRDGFHRVWDFITLCSGGSRHSKKQQHRR